MKGFLDEYRDKYRRDPDYVVEGIYLELTEQILEHMRRKGLSQKELAERMDVSEAQVSRLFGETSNMTLRTLAKILIALDAELEARLVPGSDAARTKRERWQRQKPTDKIIPIFQGERGEGRSFESMSVAERETNYESGAIASAG
jgi:transcriptional regulator with XRE-family HTH domain